MTIDYLYSTRLFDALYQARIGVNF